MLDTATSTMFSESQLRTFERSGFVVLDDMVEPSLLHRSVAAVESMKDDSHASRVRRGVAFARRNLLEFDFVHHLITQSRVQVLLDAISPGLIPVRAILFDKTGSANWTVPWHQDRSIAVHERNDAPGFGPWSTKAGVVHVQPPLTVLSSMVTLRFHLDPCGAGNGPLRVIGETHHRILDQTEVETAVATLPHTACITGAGGLLVMRPLVLHASSPAIMPSHRRVVHVEFGPTELTGGLQWMVA